MFDNCIGKKCTAIVFMGDHTLDAAVPLHIDGEFESYDENYIVIKRKHCRSYVAIKTLLVLNVDL